MARWESSRRQIKLPRAAAPTLLLLAAFALSRVVYWALGVRFDDAPLGTFTQYLDPALLRHHLFGSLWQLHSQPPLFNLYLGIVLKLAYGARTTVFALTFLALGAVLVVALFRLMLRLGVDRRVAFALAFAFAAAPGTVLFENWLYVDYAVATGLVVAALLIYRFCAGGSVWALTLAFAMLAAIVLSRPCSTWPGL